MLNFKQCSQLSMWVPLPKIEQNRKPRAGIELRFNEQVAKFKPVDYFSIVVRLNAISRANITCSNKCTPHGGCKGLDVKISSSCRRMFGSDHIDSSDISSCSRKFRIEVTHILQDGLTGGGVCFSGAGFATLSLYQDDGSDSHDCSHDSKSSH